MGAFRAQLQTISYDHRSIHTTSHSEPISVTRRIALIVIYSRSSLPPPLWDLNLGKLCYLIPVNRPPYPTSLNTHCEDPLHGVLVSNTTTVGAHHGARGASGSSAGEDQDLHGNRRNCSHRPCSLLRQR